MLSSKDAYVKVALLNNVEHQKNIGKAMLMVNVQLHDMSTCLSVLLKCLILRFRMNSFNLLYVPEMLSCMDNTISCFLVFW